MRRQIRKSIQCFSVSSFCVLEGSAIMVFGKIKKGIYRQIRLSDFYSSKENTVNFAIDGLTTCLNDKEMPFAARQIAHDYVYIIADQAPKLSVGAYVDELERRRAPTMESPSCEKVAEMVAQLLNPVLKTAFLELGKSSFALPSQAANDEFLVAYMFGALLNGFISGDIKDPKKQEWGAMYFFYTYFPNDYIDLTKSCNNRIKEKEFKRVARIGREETMKMIGGEESLPELTNHLSEIYG